MSEKKNSEIGVLLITGLLAILGTVAGGVIKGYLDTSLADKNFQTDLVKKALESGDQKVRIETLQFMIDTKLISDSKMREGLQEFLNKKPELVPQIIASSTQFGTGILRPPTEETKGFTDYDIFICDKSRDLTTSNTQVSDIFNNLVDTGRVGQVRLREWNMYKEIPLNELRDRVTIIVDKGHDESKEIPRLQEALGDSKNLPEVRIVENRGKRTEWLISLIVCPSQ